MTQVAHIDERDAHHGGVESLTIVITVEPTKHRKYDRDAGDLRFQKKDPAIDFATDMTIKTGQRYIVRPDKTRWLVQRVIPTGA